MPPFSLLLFLFPLLELALLILAGMAVGGLAVLAWIVLTAIIGIAALRRADWRRWQPLAASPAAGLADGMLLGTAGFLLFLPGLITDALGFLLLLPATRRRVVGALTRFTTFTRGATFHAWRRSSASHGDDSVIVEGEYWREESGKRPDDPRLP